MVNINKYFAYLYILFKQKFSTYFSIKIDYNFLAYSSEFVEKSKSFKTKTRITSAGLFCDIDLYQTC